ncbi:Uncharacterised protein [Helicobacter pametensis]|nr:Uncharacterised protein [Helicobacter pametensis]
MEVLFLLLSFPLYILQPLKPLTKALSNLFAFFKVDVITRQFSQSKATMLLRHSSK